ACAFALGMLFEFKAWFTERRKQLIVLVAVMLLALVNLAAFSQKPEVFGEVISLEEAKERKDWQKGGRFSDVPFPSVPAQIVEAMQSGTAASRKDSKVVFDSVVEFHWKRGQFMFWIFLVVTGLGALMNRERAIWWFCLFVSAVLLHVMARLLAFRFGWPDRYALYPLSMLTLLLFPLAWQTLIQRWPDRKNLPLMAGGSLTVGLLIFYPLGLSGIENAKTVSAESRKGVIEFVRTLPDDVYLAGWPRQDMDYIYLLAHRRVLADYESAHPLYMGYYGQIEDRIKDTMKLYFAPDHQNAVTIRDRYGLTHLVLQKSIARAKLSFRPLYQPMYNYAINRKNYARKRGGLYFEDPPKDWVVYEDEKFRVIDLSRITLLEEE
ncbi:MAG: hypothetical protein AAF492_01530, partial [Verrucomicrobiota bacterium]